MNTAPEHLVITDSGLGGLSICAAIEQRLRTNRNLRLTYVNVWPFEGKGYNDLPTVAERAEVFDRALSSLAALGPDRLLIACNTLSILYPHTAFSRASTLPVQGIIEAGVNLFTESLTAHPASSLLLLGTRTTIESNVHRNALLDRGNALHQLLPIPCHGLAAAIERDPGSPLVTELIGRCATAAQAAGPEGSPLLVGLCCTHYAYVSERLRSALEQALARPVRILDPNERLALAFSPGPSSGEAVPSVQVLSKVALGETSRRAIANLLEPLSPATAQALLHYHHVAELF